MAAGAREQKPTASKRKCPLPVNHPMTDAIPDTLENVQNALVRSMPKKRHGWDCKKSAH